MTRSSVRGAMIARPRGAASMLAGAAVAGVAAYGFQLVGTRSLGDIRYAPVGALWTLQYLAFSVFLYPVETYVARAVAHSGRRWPGAGARRHVAGWVLGSALAAGIAAWLGRDQILAGRADLAAAAAVITLSYGAFATVRGTLVGGGRYRTYAAVTAGESSVRLLAAVAFASATATAAELAWCLPAGAVVATLAGAAALRPGGREQQVHAVTDGAIPGPLPATAGSALISSTVANAAAQTLLAVGPLIVPLLGGTAREVSICFVTLTLARSPLVLGFGGLLSRMTPAVTSMARAGDEAGLRRLTQRVAVASLFGGLAVGAVAAALGPAVIGFVFGASFTPPVGLVLLAAASAILACGALALGQVLICRGLESRLVLPWLAGLGVAAAVLAVAHGGALTRIGLALVLGELAAGALLWVALVSRRPALR